MLNCTQDEYRVVVFLITVALLGVGINFCAKQFFSNKPIARFSQEVFKINLNSADMKTLMEIPGIGEKLARRIIDYRAQKGLFTDKEELKKIKGFSSYRYEKIKDYFR